VLGFLLYFLFIGAGYILIEVGLIQKFVLFLGHPTYALTVVIFSMLVSSGVGSGLSRRVLADDEGRLIKALVRWRCWRPCWRWSRRGYWARWCGSPWR